MGLPKPKVVKHKSQKFREKKENNKERTSGERYRYRGVSCVAKLLLGEVIETKHNTFCLYLYNQPHVRMMGSHMAGFGDCVVGVSIGCGE